MTSTIDTPDLTACDREPIHQLGAIQPFGFLIAVTTGWAIARVSDNVGAFAGVAADDLLGRPLADIFAREAIHELRNRLVQLFGSAGVERVFGLSLLAGDPDRCFDCAIHETGDLIVIEAEPSHPVPSTEMAGLVRSMMERLNAAPDLQKFLQQGARQMHGLTGFDRVMVYRFHSDGSGEVAAEVARSGIEPLLGLRYPASDIPQQARALYLRTPFRIICNVEATPATIVPSLDATGQPLDLSSSILRAVSPIHVVYLKNMGVTASLSVSIIVEGRLWGLFACHHYSPRCPPFDLRTMIELFGQMFSMRLENRKRQQAAEKQASVRRMADRLVADIAGDVGLLSAPAWLMNTIGDILPCDGIGLCLLGQSTASGIAPPAGVLPAMAQRLGETLAGGVFVTDHLKAAFPEACEVAGAPAGMLAIPISAEPGDWIMLFRRERVELVTWAGNPHKPVIGDGPEALSPRASFAAWREEVRGRAEPFTMPEQAVAEMLRVSLIEVIMTLAGAAVAERQRANQRQEVLIAELNHRVRNILALIGALIRQSGDSAIGFNDYIDLLEGRIQSLARAHDQITRDNWGPAPLRQLIETEGGAYAVEQRLFIADLPVMLEPLAYSTLSLVIHELMTNSAKYGALSERGSIDVDWTIEAEGNLAIVWVEQDGPTVEVPRRKGLGTMIIEKSIPHELGGDATIAYNRKGVEARFVIPARYVRYAGPFQSEQKCPTVEVLDDTATMSPFAGTVLLVEDSLLIAIHVEDMLAQLGITGVVTAATVEAALRELQQMRPAAAVLDFNLGAETSLPVADRLRADGIPYIFATGYGDQLTLPEEHARIPILQKPYTKTNLAKALALLMGCGTAG